MVSQVGKAIAKKMSSECLERFEFRPIYNGFNLFTRLPECYRNKRVKGELRLYQDADSQ